ncbi:phospholipase D family protein [Gilvimarinus algae]|uniref:Phospholipase D family protein n=1 Tax=Gilvimarinus algae TaxID=3058037 RepID=A0ABT8TAF6_9GAMM|nr:phospholipase D family protein [Gilvimarinus sp. SDUM040014]MDO3381097.1 phospholipase D family protein [Gilvimarinus sp. SDUM040014]
MKTHTTFGYPHRLVRAVTLVFGMLVVSACASAPDRRPVTATSVALEPAADAPLAVVERRAREQSAAQAAHSGVHVLPQGIDAFAARLTLVESARHSLDVQYYLFHSDATGVLLAWSLWQAAERGVRVRLLLDDMEKRQDDFPLTVLDAHPNIEVRLYNPFYWRAARVWQLASSFGRLNHRMHNKSFTADNLATVVGGRNIGDEYFDANQSINFGDMDALLLGPVVREVSSAFDRYWNSELVYSFATLSDHKPLDRQHHAWAEKLLQQSVAALEGSAYADALVNTGFMARLNEGQLPLHWANIELWVDKPDLEAMRARESGSAFVINRLLGAFSRAERELFLISPYFVPRKQGTQLLREQAEKGVEVSVVTNALAATDVVAVHSGYAKRREDLLRSGVSVFEVKAKPSIAPKAWSISSASSLHAKTFVIDKRWVFIGSFNLDPRSAWLNTEMGVLIDSPELAVKLLQGVAPLLDNIAYRVSLRDGKVVWQDMATGQTFDREPEASWWRRALAGVLRFLPVEPQL